MKTTVSYLKAKEYLSAHGIRPSLQRMAVMEYLIDHRTHPTAEQIYSALCDVIPTLSRTTVYNTLSTLVDHGAILALDIKAGQMHYDGEVAPHAHFVCSVCGHIGDIIPDERVWQEFMAAFPPPEGAVVASSQFCHKGVCAKCNTHNRHNNN